MSGGDRSFGGGSGGEADGGSGGGSATEGSPCVSFTRTVALNTPIPKVVRGLRAGDVLRIELASGVAGARIEARTSTDDVAGAVTFDGVARLKKCLEAGYTYVGIVQSPPSGGVCIIEIRHEPY